MSVVLTRGRRCFAGLSMTVLGTQYASLSGRSSGCASALAAVLHFSELLREEVEGSLRPGLLLAGEVHFPAAEECPGLSDDLEGLRRLTFVGQLQDARTVRVQPKLAGSIHHHLKNRTGESDVRL